MKRILLWPLGSLILLGLAYTYHSESQAAMSSILPDLKKLKPRDRSIPVAADCEKFSYSKPEALDDELIEMSGLVPSQIYDDLFYHVRDSGNDPYLILTDIKGKVLGRMPFAENIADPEELSYGNCPWAATPCIFVADTGDNFGWRGEGQLYAIDEQTIFKGPLKSEKLSFRYEDTRGVDTEAIAVEKATGDTFLFSKGKKHSRVYKLPAAAWKDPKEAVAKFVVQWPRDWVSGASISDDGQRLLLVSWRGVYEYSDRSSGPFFSKNRFIPFEGMGQVEAITYLPDQKTFLYSSEKKGKKRPWGLIQASCQGK